MRSRTLTGAKERQHRPTHDDDGDDERRDALHNPPDVALPGLLPSVVVHFPYRLVLELAIAFPVPIQVDSGVAARRGRGQLPRMPRAMRPRVAHRR